MDLNIKEECRRALELSKQASPAPWEKCKASDGKCSCTSVWSLPTDAPILDVVNGAWGDSYPEARIVDGKIEAYTAMIEYGSIPPETAQANKEFIEFARSFVPMAAQVILGLQDNSLPVTIESKEAALRGMRENFKSFGEILRLAADLPPMSEEWSGIQPSPHQCRRALKALQDEIAWKLCPQCQSYHPSEQKCLLPR